MTRTKRRFLAHPVGLPALLLIILSGVGGRHATASVATLDVDVYSPALPATELDIITLRAVTSDEILPSGSWQTVTTGLVVNGFDIQWDLISNDTGQLGIQIPLYAGRLEDIGPLPAGTYNVTATWAMYNNVYLGVPPQHILDLWMLFPPVEGPRTGTTQFTVVPEPTTLAIIVGGMCMLGARRRR